MRQPRAVSLTARREIRERLRSRAFLASVAVQVAIVLAIVVISALTADDGTTYDVGIESVNAPIVEILEDEAPTGVSVDVQRVPDPAEGRREVEDGTLDAGLFDGRIVVSSGTESELITLIQSAAAQLGTRQELAAAGLGAGEIERAIDPPVPEVETVGDDTGSAEGLAFIGSLLLYLAILGFGFIVTTGVVEEKGSRVVELILATIRPTELLTGKIVGIGLLGLLQLAVTAGVGIAAALISGQIELPSSTAETTVLVLVYFVLGYAFYACAFAVAGAIVSRQEDVGSVTTPLTIILVAGYLASFGVSDDPGGTLATVLTLFPPTAPLVVPARAAVDGLPAGELAASLVLMVAGTAALIWLAARIYERAILMTGRPLRLREALRLARSPD